MPAKQLPVDLKVLRVIAYRHKWMLVVLTFLSFALSAFITKSMINTYSASTTIFVDPENVLGQIADKIAVSTSLNDQLNTMRHLIINDDFIEPHVIQELDIRLSDVYVPLGKLKFMPSVLAAADTLKNVVKRVFGLEVYTFTDAQKQLMEQQELVNIIKKNIELRQSRNQLLTISYVGPNAKACQKIVDIVANQCKELLLRSKNQETREALRYIDRQYNEATQRLNALERELADMQVEMFDKGPEAKISLLTQRQAALDDSRLMEQDFETLEAQKQDLLESKAERQTVLRQDPDYMARLAQLSQNQDAIALEAKKKRLSELRQRGFTEAWPEVASLQKDIAEQESQLKTQIEDPEAEEKIFLADPIYNEYFRQVQRIETEQASLSQRQKKLAANLAIYEEKLRAMPEFEKSFASIQRRIKLQEDLQIDLAKRRETASATMELEKARGENRIRIVGREYPNSPIGLPPIVIMAAICMMGPGVGAGLIALLYYLNSSVKSAEDVRIEYNLPVIAIIPQTNFKRELQEYKKRLKSRYPKQRKGLSLPSFLKKVRQVSHDGKQHPLAFSERHDSVTRSKSHLLSDGQSSHEIAPASMNNVQEIELFGQTLKRVPAVSPARLDDMLMVTMLTNPTSHAAEEYRRLCFNVEWGVKESFSGPCKTIMVTSALPGEGKTITAINLATTLARNHQVLLVDANFRRPSIDVVYGIPRSPGLSDMLEQQMTPQLYVPPGSPNLSILSAGMTGEHPADLLSSKQMHGLLESVKGSSFFEYAIFDVPPVSLIPDSAIIASLLDGVVWVIWELHTSKDVVRLALSRVMNPAIFGVVLNRSEQQPLPKRYSKIWKTYHKNSSTHSKM